MSSNWLEVYLAEAVRKDLCTKIRCTTCGASEFRQGLLNALSDATGQPALQYFDRDSALDTAKALAGVETAKVLAESNLHRPPQAAFEFELHKFKTALEDAVRCILFDLCSGIPRIERDNIEALLAGTWPGEILHIMIRHHEALETERRARAKYESPDAVKERRDEKKRLKQEEHEKRLALKKERDRLWHEKSGTTD